MNPATGALDDNDLCGAAFQQLAVVTHHQNGGLARFDLFFEPSACGDIEIVVWFVKQQYVGARREH